MLPNGSHRGRSGGASTTEFHFAVQRRAHRDLRTVVDGKPMPWAGALLQACCLTTPVESEEAKTTITSIGIAAPRILRAGEHVDFFTMPKVPRSTEFWSKFNVERSKISTRVCYCSVFDQCWVHVSGPGLLRKDPKKIIHPDRVDSFVAPAVPYQVNAPPAR
jgi:hypothetical protein